MCVFFWLRFKGPLREPIRDLLGFRLGCFRALVFLGFRDLGNESSHRGLGL